MPTDIPDKKNIERQLNGFLQDTHALMLATVNAEGLPEASYAPYVAHEGCYYIFISQLASHTANLQHSGVASVLLMNTEDSGQAFARKRLTCHCKATVIARQEALFESILRLMEERFGKLIRTLRELGDFNLFQLDPIKGNYVAGFGQAFEIDFPLGRDIRLIKPN